MNGIQPIHFSMKNAKKERKRSNEMSEIFLTSSSEKKSISSGGIFRLSSVLPREREEQPRWKQSIWELRSGGRETRSKIE